MHFSGAVSPTHRTSKSKARLGFDCASLVWARVVIKSVWLVWCFGPPAYFPLTLSPPLWHGRWHHEVQNDNTARHEMSYYRDCGCSKLRGNYCIFRRSSSCAASIVQPYRANKDALWGSSQGWSDKGRISLFNGASSLGSLSCLRRKIGPHLTSCASLATGRLDGRTDGLTACPCWRQNKPCALRSRAQAFLRRRGTSSTASFPPHPGPHADPTHGKPHPSSLPVSACKMQRLANRGPSRALA
ncbi:hypothetical protein B0J13DRAFT_68589 [Dactylonectria estremocensis]|uniref:Uncharacterized protein n=1 Tax=Dactylonectria estremocensis TaxID=1079267 RepID=A0A9P9EHY7_9HYPO|nr:hypothetical protein B0J13DRAFT_68589 [Dactylonectria estremocensis]